MDERQLIAELVKAVASLAWPAVVAFALWLFRKEIVRILPRMRFKYKDAEIDFRLAQAERDAKALPPVPPEEAPEPTPEEEDRFKQLARISPRAAIVEMRSELEQSMIEYASRHGIADEARNKFPSILRMTRIFRAKSLISPEASALLDDVRAIGNSAVHSRRGDEFTMEDAERFRKLWELAMAQFRNY